jgi:hypothetical protein
LDLFSEDKREGGQNKFVCMLHDDSLLPRLAPTRIAERGRGVIVPACYASRRDCPTSCSARAPNLELKDAQELAEARALAEMALCWRTASWCARERKSGSQRTLRWREQDIAQRPQRTDPATAREVARRSRPVGSL